MVGSPFRGDAVVTIRRRPEVLAREDLDARAAHLGEQRPTGRVDVLDIGELDADRDCGDGVLQGAPCAAQLLRPIPFESSREPQGVPRARFGEPVGGGDSQHGRTSPSQLPCRRTEHVRATTQDRERTA
jgi:hypothetical protein